MSRREGLLMPTRHVEKRRVVFFWRDVEIEDAKEVVSKRLRRASRIKRGVVQSPVLDWPSDIFFDIFFIPKIDID
jgi:hypothetical protein